MTCQTGRTLSASIVPPNAAPAAACCCSTKSA